MKIKKILALVLSLCMVLGLWACAESEPATQESTQAPTQVTGESQITPLVYEVTDATGNTIWVMGSIHAGYDYFYPLPDYALNAYEAADTLAVEFDVIAFEYDFDAQMSLSSSMLYTDGSKVSDHISQELYERAVKAMTDGGFYMEALDYYTAITWYQLFDELLMYTVDVSTDLGIDMHFLNKAYEDGKTIASIESAEFQMDMLNNFSDPLQAMLLESALDSFEDPETYQADLEALITCWASGNEADMVALLASESDGLTEEELVLYEEYNKAISTDRNIGMADFAENALNNGEETLIVVGAAHVVGEGGIIDLLTQRGYTVTCIGGTPMENAA